MITIRVMLITRKVDFSLRMARALEQVGGFLVRSFTSPHNAIEYLKQHPQDVALVDFEMSEMAGETIISALRRIQPELAVVVAPQNRQMQQLVSNLHVQGMVNLPINARQFMPILRHAVEQLRDFLPDTQQIDNPSYERALSDDDSTQTMATNTPPVPPPTTNASFELVLSDYDEGTQLQATQSGEMLPDDSPTEVFKQLAQEEPPMPDFQESGTVSDFIGQVKNTSDLGQIIDSFVDATFDTETGGVVEPDLGPRRSKKKSLDDSPTEKPASIPAMHILQQVLDFETQAQSTPVDSFSIGEFLKNVDQQMPEGSRNILPLPSWVRESVRYAREPDFLSDDLFNMDESGAMNLDALEYTSTPTSPSGGDQTQIDADNIVTEIMEPVHRSHPPDALSSTTEPVDIGQTQYPAPQPPPTLPEEPKSRAKAQSPDSGATATSKPDMPPPHGPPTITESGAVLLDDTDPHLAQIAVTLTQASLELTAEATVLSRGHDIMAYAGNMPLDDIETLREQIGDEWGAMPKQARLRFARLESTGEDYMLYSRSSDIGFTLTMIFVGTLPLSVIQRQGKRLADALNAVPASEQEQASQVMTPVQDAEQTPDVKPDVKIDGRDEVPTEPRRPDKDQTKPARPAKPFIAVPEVEARVPYTYLWLLRDADATISDEAAQSLIMGLDVQLTQRGWRVHGINVGDNYVNLFADVPHTELERGNLLIDELMRLSAELIHGEYPGIDPDTLWGDSYLALTPGRELSQSDIRRFIRFARFA